MSLKKLLGIFSGLCFALNMFGGNPRFDTEGRFWFCFTPPVLNMLNERLSGVQKVSEEFVFNQERFEELVNKTNELGWCELLDNEKREIIKCLLYVNKAPTKACKSRLLEIMDCLSEVNSEGLTCFAPTDRDDEIHDYIWSVREYLEHYN